MKRYLDNHSITPLWGDHSGTDWFVKQQQKERGLEIHAGSVCDPKARAKMMMKAHEKHIDNLIGQINNKDGIDWDKIREDS